MDFFYDWLELLRVIIQENIWLAPFFGVILPFIEALFPSIPLTVLIAFNLGVLSSAYGGLEGTILTILLSTFGSFMGMFLIFLLIRVTFANYFARKVNDNKYGRMFLNIVDGKNVWLVLIILSNPFMPSAILNYALSLTKIRVPKYIFLTLSSRLIIVLFLVFLGSVFDIQSHPLNVLWMMLAYFALLGVWIIYLRSRKNKENSVFKDSE